MFAAEGGWAGVVHPLVALTLFLLAQALFSRDLAIVRSHEPPAAATSAA